MTRPCQSGRSATANDVHYDVRAKMRAHRQFQAPAPVDKPEGSAGECVKQNGSRDNEGR
jgi:hypothetical protein